MQIRRCAQHAVAGVLVLLSLASSPVRAQSDHTHAAAARFHDVAVAEHEGYFLQFGCVSGSEYGAMGMHFVNFPLVEDGALDASQPETSFTNRSRTAACN
jgi:hypothetical protein